MPFRAKEKGTMMRSGVVALLVLLGAVSGCATASPPGQAIRVDNVAALSGKWLGFATGTAAGAPNPVELDISPDGTWTSRTGAQLQGGKVVLDGDKINFTRQSASGSSTTVGLASTAVLQMRAGKRVLVGQGRSDFGPYSYEFTEQK
jgi:hypothetical protein